MTDSCLNSLGREAAGVDVGGIQGGLHDLQTVVLIVNGEARVYIKPVGVDPQEIGAKAVKCADAQEAVRR